MTTTTGDADVGAEMGTDMVSDVISDAISDTSTLLRLPNELIDAILEHLPPHSLALAAQTCRALRRNATLESIWRAAVQAQLPPRAPALAPPPYPCASFRALYASLDPLWFLPRHALWFCDTGLAGSLVVFRFDPRRGCIEGYRVAAMRHPSGETVAWTWDVGGGGDDGLHHIVANHVVLKPLLHLDMPFVQFDARANGANVLAEAAAASACPTPRFAAKVCIRNEYAVPNFSTVALQLASPVPPAPDPCDRPTWPPSVVPAANRVAAIPEGLRTPYELSTSDIPTARADISEHAFRIVRHRTPVAHGSVAAAAAAAALSAVSAALRDDVHLRPLPPHMVEAARQHSWYMTYATLDRALYTPTAEHPWRGIWVGDYGPHGCEFLLLHQPGGDDNDGKVSNDNDGKGNNDDNDDDALARQWERDPTWEWRRKNPAAYRSDIVAIKLTGDPNVPRGEVSWVVPDLDAREAVQTQPGGEDVRAVRSRGHVAHHGFQDDEWLPGLVLLLSEDCIAHYWIDLGVVAYFQRVDVDELRVV